MMLFRAGVVVGVVWLSGCAHGGHPRPLTAEPQPVAEDPQDGDAHFNAGLKLQLQEQPALALPHFEAAVRAAPDDWAAVAKLIQVNQALGKLSERDRWRATLLAMYKAGKIVNPKMPVFCRDQFALGKRWVMVLETFELKGPQGVRYSFNVQSDKQNGETLLELTLASSDWDNAAARAEGKIGPDGRVFFLDAFSGGTQSLLEYFGSEPTYDDIRERVIKQVKSSLPEDVR